MHTESDNVLTRLIPRDWAVKNRIVPLEQSNGCILVGAVRELDPSIQSTLSFLTGRKIELRLLEEEVFESQMLERYGEASNSAEGSAPARSGHKIEAALGRGSVVQQVNDIVEQAIRLRASDIHIEPYESVFRVRFRIDGMLQHVADLDLEIREAVISRIKILANLDIAEKRRPQDGRIRFEAGDRTVDLRISTLPTDSGEKVVLRILDKREQHLDLRELGLGESNLTAFTGAINVPYGMILVTGPTGSGKSTTLYAALNELNSEAINITTIEDPIEYHLPGINQTQVRGDIGLTFSRALRSILRQDPNVIMVGEIRDLETAEIAVRAALTGHLVFSTLHTNDAPSAITRLMDMGIEPFLLASSVRLVMAQRLVRKICRQCKTPSHPDPLLLKELDLPASGREYAIGSGCEHCHGTGYRGRTALFEMMPVSESISGLIASKAGAGELKNTARSDGMQTLREAGRENVLSGVTTVAEVLRETSV